LQWTGCESTPQPLGYESDALPLDHCTHRYRTLIGSRMCSVQLAVLEDLCARFKVKP